MVALKPNPRTPAEQANLVSVLDEVLTARLTCLKERIAAEFHKSGKSLFHNPQLHRDRPLHIFPLGGGLEVWTGLHGAVKSNLQGGLMLNVDLGHSVFYKTEYNLLKFYVEIVGNSIFDRRVLDELRQMGMDASQRKRLEEALKGKTLVYTMPREGGRKKAFKFSSIGTKAASRHSFRDRQTGREMNIEQYYYRVYNIRLQCPHLPCICINKNQKIYVPLEFVTTDHTVHKFKGKMHERQQRKMIQDTAFPPQERKKILVDMASVQGEGNRSQPLYLAEQDDYMANYGVAVDRRLIKVTASLLPPPTLSFGQGVKHTDREHKEEWELQNGDSLKKVKNQKMVIPAIIFLTPEEKGKPNNLQPLGTLMEVLHNFGVALPGGKGSFFDFRFDSCSQTWDVVVSWMRTLKKKVAERYGKEAIPLALYIFPEKCTSRRQWNTGYFSEYSMIKYICDVEIGVYCQCLLWSTYAAMEGSNPLTCTTAHNVALKILGKIGAVLCTLEDNDNYRAWGLMTNPKEPVLILGIDVTHPGIQDRNEGRYAATSVASVVGNVDLDCMQFECSVRAQVVGQERTLCITNEARERMTAFAGKTGTLPKHIVVLRDGVSESQFQETLYEELNAVKEACKDIAPDYKTTVTYILLTKRHHTRFFPLEEEDTTGKMYNLKPGTLVESHVTTRDYFDFYLTSHAGPIGTSRPGHYYVLWDEWKPNNFHWQEVINAMAYGYVRCPKAISQPAPVMYAHLAAQRAKDYLMAHVNVHRNRLDRMSDYEVVTEFKKAMQKHSELQGMPFV